MRAIWIRLALAEYHKPSGRGPINRLPKLGFVAVAVTGVMMLLATPNQAGASCSGKCTEEQSATGLASPPEWAEGRKIHFEPETTKASAYSEAELEGEGGPLLYNESGNGVQHSPKVFLALWGSNFNTSEKGKEVKAMLLKLFEGLSSSSYQGILTQYFDSTGRISSSVSTASWVDESYAAPSSVSELGVEEEVQRAINANGWKAEKNAQFLVVTAPGSTYAAGFITGFCAYHGVTVASSKVTAGSVYDFVPYQGDPPLSEGCIGTGNPSKNPVFKTSKSSSHEYAEAATNPEPGFSTSSWRSPSGPEIADICRSLADFELPSGAYAQDQYDDHLNAC